MPLIVFILSFLLSSSLQAVEARVLIDEQSSSKILTGEFKVRCLPFKKNVTCNKKRVSFGAAEWLVVRVKKGLLLTNQKTGRRVRLRGSSFEFSGNFRMENRPVRNLSFYRVGKKSHWVLKLPVDQYLYGVIAAEVPVSWPAESLKAQAIASRTYFLHKKMERVKKHFDVRSTTLDQVFSMNPKKHKSIVDAVDDTHGLVLVSSLREEIFPAYFHSDCGGHTSSEGSVWRNPTSLNKEVRDLYCNTATKNNWSYHIDKATLLTTLKKVFYLPSQVTLKSIFPRRSAEDRAHVVDFIFSGNILKRIGANDLRKALGFTKLKSTQFIVHNRGKNYYFEGRGFGHGVGMCQWGAQRWARKGKTFQFILGHYYPRAKILKMDSKNFQSLQAQLVY